MSVSQVLVNAAQLLLDAAVVIEGADVSLISADLQRAETQLANLRGAIVNLKNRTSAPTLDVGEPERVAALADGILGLINLVTAPTA